MANQNSIIKRVFYLIKLKLNHQSGDKIMDNLNHLLMAEDDIIKEIIYSLSFCTRDDLLIEQFYLIIDRVCFLLQKLHPNIMCYTGCNLCCKENGNPELNDSEWRLLKSALENLSFETIEVIREKVTTQPLQTHECPLLVEGKCTVYAFRPFKCRTNGYFFQDTKKESNFISFSPATCSTELPRWNKEVDFNDKRYQSIPVQSSFLKILQALSNNKKQSSLHSYLKGFFG